MRRLLKKRFDLFTLAACALCLALPATYLACRKPAPPATPSVQLPVEWGVPELIRHLRGKGLRLHAVPTDRSGNMQNGAYLCERPRPWEELAWLTPSPERAPAWAGVVLAAPAQRGLEQLPEDVQSWGANGLIAGHLLLFGDEALLRRVAAALGGG